MAAQKPSGPRAAQDPEALRKRVLEDPYSEQIAQHLGVPLQEYVEQVVHYVLRPREEPSLYIVEDRELRAMGCEPPDPEAMGRFVIEAATLAEVEERRGGPVEAEMEKKLRVWRN